MLNPTFNSNFPLDIFIVLEAKRIVLFSDASQPLSSQLYKDLIADYQPDVLPLYNKSKPVEVDFGMALQQIQNVVCVHSHTYVNIEISLLHQQRSLHTSRKVC